MRERFELPDRDCIRMTRDEMASTRMVLVLASELHFAKDDLKKRLEVIPDGPERMETVVDECDSLFRDILGTVSDKQRKTLRNSANDYEIRLAPKMTPENFSMAVAKDDMTVLVNCAREKCKYCSLAGQEVAKCALYKLLETYIPLNDYGSDEIICPYAYQEWAR